jgi:hypothetical protein
MTAHSTREVNVSRLEIGAVALGAMLATLALTSLGASERGPVDWHQGPIREAAQTAKQSHCMKICRARYRDCQSQKLVPAFECRDVYQDCIHFTCNGAQG